VHRAAAIKTVEFAAILETPELALEVAAAVGCADLVNQIPLLGWNDGRIDALAIADVILEASAFLAGLTGASDALKFGAGLARVKGEAAAIDGIIENLFDAPGGPTH
jgi:hypothetical protein